MIKRILIIFAILFITGTTLLSPIMTPSARGADGFPPNGAIDFPLGNNLTITAGGAVYFEGTGTSDNAIMSFDWDFGGGATDTTLEDPGFVVFPGAGTFVVTFTVTDDEFLSDPTPDTRTITVNPSGVNASPTADAGGPYAAYTGDTINFDATASTDDGSIVTYQWDFGDTTTAVGATPGKSYSAIGAYNVILTVVDDDGATDTETIVVDVFTPGIPVALFSAAPRSGALPLTVTFSDDSLTQDTIVGWDWDFGDFTTSSLENPTHIYILDGIFDVTLTITEASSATDTLTKTGYVAPGTGNALDPDRWLGPGLIVGQCFIATAAYGSYFDPHVLVLRDLRDRFLLTNRPGRAFVKLYYHLSPPAAEFISRRPWLKSVTRVALMPLVYLSKFVLYTSGIQKIILLTAFLSLAFGFYAFTKKSRAGV